LTLGPKKFDADVAVLDETGFVQSLAECDDLVVQHSRRPGAEEPDHRNRRLLRARAERPRDRRAAEQPDELAPLQMIEPHVLLSVRGPCCILLKMPTPVTGTWPSSNLEGIEWVEIIGLKPML